MKRQISVLRVIVVVALAFGLPVVVSVTDTRTAFHPNLGFLRVYDTSLSGDELSHEMFKDVVWWHERYSTNPIARLFGLLLDRRIKIVAVRGADSDYPEYDVQLYTYFNIPYYKVNGYGAKGGEPTLGYVDISLKEF